MVKKKVILDTNVIISAFGWEGNTRNILWIVLRKDIEMVLSKKQIRELRKVLEYPKFGFSDEQKKNIISTLFSVAIVVDTKKDLSIIHDDPDDNMLLETASEQDVDIIVTGDEHVLRVKRIGKTIIITPAEFLKLVHETGGII